MTALNETKNTIDAFAAVFGEGTPYRAYTAADAERLASRVPLPMRELLEREGFCSYHEQVLWLCDPDDWKDVARAWLPDARDPRVVARTGLGELFLWDGDVFWFAMVHEPLVMGTVANADAFFSRTLTAPDFALRTYLPGCVSAARATLGPLAWDEMYAPTPALALGGTNERMERVKARQALQRLATLVPVRRAR